jgi:hypothetical protein
MYESNPDPSRSPRVGYKVVTVDGSYTAVVTGAFVSTKLERACRSPNRSRRVGQKVQAYYVQQRGVLRGLGTELRLLVGVGRVQVMGGSCSPTCAGGFWFADS